MTGLAQLQAMLDGTVPPAPMAQLLDFVLEEVDEGRAVFRAHPGAQHANPMGTVHGGLALTLLDSAAGAAVHTTLPPGASYGTLETKGNLVRPITTDAGPLVAIGEVVHRGSRVATAEARVVGARDGRLYAHGSSTCMVLGA